jgi:hypothetical protein
MVFGESQMKVDAPKFIEVYRAGSLPEAHAVRAALEAEGIHVQLEGEILQGAVGELPTGWQTAPRLLVDESQVVAARQLIERVARQRSQPSTDAPSESTRCLACGRELAETEVKCPSCGWSYQGEEEVAP